ncbi:hypothetical protein GCM10010199_04300 [Dactylosporangium roseum]
MDAAAVGGDQRGAADEVEVGGAGVVVGTGTGDGEQIAGAQTPPTRRSPPFPQRVVDGQTPAPRCAGSDERSDGRISVRVIPATLAPRRRPAKVSIRNLYAKSVAASAHRQEPGGRRRKSVRSRGQPRRPVATSVPGSGPPVGHGWKR